MDQTFRRIEMSLSRRRPLAQAMADFDDFRNLLKPDLTCLRFEVAEGGEGAGFDAIADETC